MLLAFIRVFCTNSLGGRAKVNFDQPYQKNKDWRNVRVDSLFLDEGFGTLDEDALETALETLSSLQQDGKLIGVISHVQALKDRIPTQIHVTPTHNGRSRLNVPRVGG